MNKYLVEQCGIDPRLRLLIYLRVSQINGCSAAVAFCWQELRALGEAESRLSGLSAWRNAPFYSARERAALEWAEAVTLLSGGRAFDRIYHTVRAEFTEEELGKLTLAVNSINSWNRLNLAFPRELAACQPPEFVTSG